MLGYYLITQVGVLETGEESYLVEPVSGTAHIAYEVQRSPLPKVENIGGSNDDGGRNFVFVDATMKLLHLL